MTTPANLAASVLARLLNRAKETGDDHQTLLASYCLERFLYRLGASDCHGRFVLKGAMLLRLWSDRPYRATRDLDLLRRGDGAFAAIRDDLRAIIATPVPPDGVTFDGESIEIEPIRAEDEYAGTRATLLARCGQARLTLQIDMGLGDSVWPEPRSCAYPALLDFPAPALLAYPREAVVAEKLEAMVVLGDRNSRIKDFFDLHHLAGRFEFDRATLREAARRTFERRHTPIPAEDPIGLTPDFWENPTRPAQVRAFARRSRIDAPERPASDFVHLLHAFLAPVLEDLRKGAKREGTWRPGGPWR
ncbi:MAG: nucleotidyl transferase AbiEii/AbiGii toxin family protein [Burkholderiales bacterium]|nr:nucleotidyl transferase AbiEii/AbiGii toxin family protein [Burkholderiales bacterium]MCL4689971.1 nucleotidyl transferase AbiEii/AbiGii toxin family protein [Burkholderiales bacterium]